MTAPAGRASGEPDPVGAVEALAVTHAWFERHSGWAPPDPETLTDWAAEGGGRAPDDCWVATGAACRHGLVSWQVVLDALARDDEARVAAGGRRPDPTPRPRG